MYQTGRPFTQEDFTERQYRKCSMGKYSEKNETGALQDQNNLKSKKKKVNLAFSFFMFWVFNEARNCNRLLLT